MTKQQSDKLKGDVFIALLIILALCLCFFTGCAAQEPASTDQHHRIPQIGCTEVKYEGRIRQMCCEGERCWFTN